MFTITGLKYRSILDIQSLTIDRPVSCITGPVSYTHLPCSARTIGSMRSSWWTTAPPTALPRG